MTFWKNYIIEMKTDQMIGWFGVVGKVDYKVAGGNVTGNGTFLCLYCGGNYMISIYIFQNSMLYS